MNLFYIILTCGIAFLLIRTFMNSRPGLSIDEAQAALKSGTAVLIDVRESAEWTDGVAKDAALMPLSDLRSNRKIWRPFLEKNKDKLLLLYCHSGARSGMAARLLSGEGLNAVNTGGLGTWSQSGWPVAPLRNRR